MNNKIAFVTPRLNACFIDDANQHLVIDLYGRKENIKFVEGIDAEMDIRLGKECYDSHQNIGSYLIFKKDDNKFVGIGGVQKQEPMADGSFAMSDADIEFLIVTHQEFGGVGFASEFCTGFFDNFFTTFPSLSIPARVNKNNSACIGLLKKFGFKQEGEVDYHVYGNKFALLKADFNSWMERKK